ncbi:hypothetical protein ES703_122453 [subsurface metagenome]
MAPFVCMTYVTGNLLIGDFSGEQGEGFRVFVAILSFKLGKVNR